MTKTNNILEADKRKLVLQKSILISTLCDTPKNRKLLTELGKVVLKIHKLDRKILFSIKNSLES